MCRQHLQGLLRFHKPELNLSKWPLAQRTQRVQALKALAGWCSSQKLALNNNNRKKQIKEKWLWFSVGQNVRHTFLLTQTVKQHRSRSLQFQKSWSSTPHVLPREIFKKSQQHGRFQWAALTSHRVAGRALTCSVSVWLNGRRFQRLIKSDSEIIEGAAARYHLSLHLRLPVFRGLSHPALRTTTCPQDKDFRPIHRRPTRPNSRLLSAEGIQAKQGSPINSPPNTMAWSMANNKNTNVCYSRNA